MIPLQNIPDSKKDPKWAEECVRSIMMMAGNSFTSKEKDRFCYNLHNGIFNEADFDYLRKVDTYEFPAKVRFIPILRPKCDYLKSVETKRPFNVKAFTIDIESLKNKQDQMAKSVLDKVESKITEKLTRLREAQMELDRIQGSIDEQIQAIQQQQEQGGQQTINVDRGLTDQLEKAKRQIELLKQPFKREEVFSGEDMEQIEVYYKFKYRDYLEILADKAIKYAFYKYNFKEVFNDGFEDRIVVDKEYYFVDYMPGSPDPVLRRVNPLRFWYSMDEEARWVGDCQWTMEERYLSLNQIIDEFKGDLSPEHIEELKKLRGLGVDDYSMSSNYSPYQYGNQASYSTDNCSNEVYAGSQDSSATYRVCYCNWLSPRQIRFKKSKSKKNGAEFTKWLRDEDTTKPDEELDVQYVNDRWEGICISGSVFIKLRKSPVQLRSEDEYGKVQLPYVGLNRKPYSLVWAAKDLQLLYNLMNYHKELMIALAGVRGFVMDKSQIPDGMSPSEWLYQRKLGIGWIQTVKEGRQTSQFNQFQGFDDSLSPSIQFVIQICDHLKGMVDDITGVSKQSMGMISNGELVGNTEAAISQSSLVTEIIFWRHDLVKRMAMQRWVNLCKVSWKKGKRAAYIGEDFMHEIMHIPEGEFGKADFELFVTDGGKESKSINELKSMLAQEYGKGSITLPQMIQIHSMDSLKMMEATAEKYYELAEKKAMGNNQNAQEFEMQKIQADQEFQMKMKDYDAQLKQIDNQINMAKVDIDKQKLTMEYAFKEKELGVKSNVDVNKSGTERQVEMAYLDEQKREADMDYEINRLELANKISTETAKDVGKSKNIEKVKN